MPILASFCHFNIIKSAVFNIKGEGIFEKAFTFYVKLFLTRPAKTSPESGFGAGRRRAEGPSGPGKEDADRSDRMEPL